MQKKVRNIILVAQIAVVVVVGLFFALGINAILASVLVGLTPMDVKVAKDAPAAAADQQDPAAAEPNAMVYNRNLFNSYVDDEGAPEESEEVSDAEEEPPPMEPARPGVPVESDIKAELIGTQVADDPSWSLAILRNLDQGQDTDADYRRIGQDFMEDATIVWIERDRVFFKRHSNNNRVEFIHIDTSASDIMARSRKTESSARGKKDADAKKNKSGAGKTEAPPAAGQRVARAGGGGAVDPNRIKDLGGSKYGVPRDMAEAVRTNPKILNSPEMGPPPQIQPVYKGGGVEGFRVLGIQNDSIYGKLGIRNGDIIMSVNGAIVDNPQKALSFFDQLNPGEDVGVKVNRRGRHRTLTYTLDTE